MTADRIPSPGPAGLVDRRGFLQLVATTTGGLVLAAHLPRGEAAETKLAPSAVVRIEPDNRIIVQVPKTEMGQGVRTSLALLIAEELGADWEQVVVETPALDARYDDQGTGGSGSVRWAFVPLRKAGAAMREMLIGAAAARWHVAPKQLRVEHGVVIDDRGNRRLTYGQLAADAAKQPIPANPPLVPRAQWRLIGKEHVSKDAADVAFGRAQFGIDQRLPGMLYASIERPRERGATVGTFAADAARAVPGVTQVFAIEPGTAPLRFDAQIAGGVVVVARSTWAAFAGRRKLAVQWKSGPHATETTAAHRAEMLAALDKPGTEIVHKIGDPAAVLAKASRVIRADYEVPFIAHATMEPMNCTAHWHDGKLTLWAPTQDPDFAAKILALRLGLKPAQIAINVTRVGGGFGRRLNVDYCVEAGLVAQQVAAPVQVVWTREDDLTSDFYRPSGIHRLEACLDERGEPAAFRHRLCNPAIDVTYSGDKAKNPGADEIHGAGDAFYRLPQRTSEYTLLHSGIPRGYWRSVNTTHATFALESFMDELAEAAGTDPLAFRLALLAERPAAVIKASQLEPFSAQRMADCLQLAASRANWGKPVPAGHGLGLACCFDHHSYAASVIEASLDGDRIAIHRVVCAADCGTVINPTGARAQLESAVVQGLSAAMFEQITVDGGGAVETNFHAYRLMRMHEAPAVIEAVFVDRPDVPVTGLGEPGLPTVAPALANALYRATGKRMRTLPFRPPATSP